MKTKDPKGAAVYYFYSHFMSKQAESDFLIEVEAPKFDPLRPSTRCEFECELFTLFHID
jgi:hypothetical protein